jgi:putative transposase
MLFWSPFSFAVKFELTPFLLMEKLPVPLSENHLRSLIKEYIAYYNNDRTHSSIARDSPHGRLAANRPPDGKLISSPGVRGLHHRYLHKKDAA